MNHLLTTSTIHGGRFLASQALSSAQMVRHIVLDAASVPPEGELGLESMKVSHRERIVQSQLRPEPRNRGPGELIYGTPDRLDTSDECTRR